MGKGDVGFSHTPEGDECCSNCSLYVPDRTGDGYGACITVGGKIHPSDHCTYWGPYEGEGAVPCNE